MRFSTSARRGLAFVALATASTLVAAGCSAGSLGSSTDTGEGGEAVTLTYLLGGNDDATVASAAKLVEAFQAANPGITVETESRPGGSDGDNLIKTKLSTQDMSDVFAYNNGSLLAALKPTTNLVPMAGEAWASTLDKVFVDATTVDGQLFGAPNGTAFGGGVLYNTKVYEQLGLQIPKTWDEFMANNDKIKAAGITPVEATYGDTWTSQLPVLADYANVEAANPDFAEQYTAGQAKYATTPAALAGFQHIEELSKGGYFNKNFASAKFNDGLKDIASGKAAHYPQIGSVAAGLDALSDGKTNDVGMFAWPGQDAGKNTLTVWSPNAFYIPKTTEGAKLEAAKKFVAFTQTQPGCDAVSSAALPTGPYLNSTCTLPDDVITVAKDTSAYFEAGDVSPALEFKSPIKGPSLEQICIQVGTGQESGDKGAALYDADVKKQAQQLGLPGWD
ncbi:ABC transporter substrate-binding protein [Microlunatus capsulatus]|uniref:Raffinose/stachyose/melibiose transport system substrate-binding protein n=1 Tax=Microlunatus capsulatus TaxID=99117 RepID=A0ABS4Z6Q5_9ACTN|nr:extracellular solute-binding protein [Microlunatus capsulatus]MBP2416726.1 raffinose/stachyose/melibiose transport system substrate-binding protein [Microlunatus capsulatus]